MSPAFESVGRWPPPDDDPQVHNPHSDEETENEVEMKDFGHVAEAPAEHTFRGMSVNVGGLAKKPDECTKVESLLSLVKNRAPDAIGIQEVGINFRNAGSTGQWKQRLGWNSSLDGRTTKTIATYNENDHTS